MNNKWFYLLLLPLINDMIVPVLSSSCRIVAENVNSDDRFNNSTAREYDANGTVRFRSDPPATQMQKRIYGFIGIVHVYSSYTGRQ